jgi:hypothetical protein
VRRVACYSVSSVLSANERPCDVIEELTQAIAAWLNTKGLQLPADGSVGAKLKDGRDATVSVAHGSIRDDVVWELSLSEPTDFGRFLTRICLGGRDGRVHLFLEMRAGGDGALVVPLDTDVRCPQVFRQLLDRRTWTSGQTPARTAPVEWCGADAAHRFWAVIRHKDRNLPVVAVSEYRGVALVPSLAMDLARDLCGVALVASLDQAASWEVTNTIGKEWSCFNGAVRLYWPFRGADVSAFDNPIWTRERLVEQAGTEVAAAGRIRNQLRRRLLELSTYTFDEPVEIRQIRNEAARARFDEQVQLASKSGNHAELAEQYFNEAARLEGELERERDRAERLEDQVRGLSQALQYAHPALDAAEDIAPEPASPVSSVQEAVERATREFRTDLVFGADVHRGVETIARNAGPPDKIYDYLKTLAQMSRERRNGGLGKDMLIWLKEEGIKASSESQTVLNSSAEMQARTWEDGQGVRRPFDKHLKPKEGTSPDQCVRIYFTYDERIDKVVVAWVGRHP